MAKATTGRWMLDVPDDGFTPAEISENAEVILEKRYLVRDRNGQSR